jgi:pSer/pThr/pTyr-binding forkhead associated (FHA) protein
MKIIKIGRDTSNDVVISHDPLVSHAHCQIIENYGEYTLLDCNSLNGTYVNGMKMRRNGEVRIKQSDIIRIGNTTLPWIQYFMR